MKLFDYLFILLVLILVSYANRDPQSFLMRNSMEQEFIQPLTVSYPQGLDDVSLTNSKAVFLCICSLISNGSRKTLQEYFQTILI